MKKLILLAAIALGVVVSATAQENKPEGYKFTDKKVVKTVPITNQYRSGTCWCFSTLSFLEEEVLAAGGEQMTLSQMWVVRHAYFDKAIKYVRLHGHLNFAVGGAAHDVTEMIAKYGIVPLEVYSGYNYGTEMPEFGEIDNVLKGYVDAIIKNGNGRLTTAWIDGLNAILDTYFGVRPEKFTYKGKEYSYDTSDANIGLNKIYALVGHGTASASELVINSLRGIDFPVYLYGGRTEGKNVGMTTTQTSYKGRNYMFSPITFRVSNAKGFGDYPDGFEPDVLINNQNDSYSDDIDNVFPYSFGDWGDMGFNKALYHAYKDIVGSDSGIGRASAPSKEMARNFIPMDHTGVEMVYGRFGNVIYR